MKYLTLTNIFLVTFALKVLIMPDYITLLALSLCFINLLHERYENNRLDASEIRKVLDKALANIQVPDLTEINQKLEDHADQLGQIKMAIR